MLREDKLQKMEQNNPRLNIPFDVLEDHIQCSICLSPMRGTVLTPCGHRYCYKCISEWTGREHSCPCCKKQLQVDSFYYDVQFDYLVEQILLHRDKAEQDHFDSMFDKVTAPTECSESGNTALSPFQEILRKHLKKSMVSIEQYFYKLHQDFQHKIHKLESGIIPEELRGSSKDPGEIRHQIERHLKESENLAAEALDRYLSTSIPTLDFLPVSVSVYISDKRMRFNDMIFKPTDCVSDVRKRIEDGVRGHNDEVTSWTEGGVILLVSPLSKLEHYDDIDDLLTFAATRDDITVLTWDSQPVLQNFMRPGSEIVLHKTLKLQADEPLKCYAQLFTEQGPQPVDYFSCEDCNLKWICKSCLHGCHSAHRTATFVLQHTPSWGCCYCPKKKRCQLQTNQVETNR